MNIEDRKWEMMFDSYILSKRIKELGDKINQDYKGKIYL